MTTPLRERGVLSAPRSVAARLLDRLGLLPLARRALGSGVLGRFLQNASAAFVIGVVGRFISFPITIALTRILGTEEYGQYILVTNYLGLFLIVGTLGFDTSTLRFLPMYRTDREWGLLHGFVNRTIQIVLVLTLSISTLVALTMLIGGNRFGGISATFLAACLVLPLVGLNTTRDSSIRASGNLVVSESTTKIAMPTLHAMSVAGVFFVLGQRIESSTAMLLRSLVEAAILLFSSLVLRRLVPAEAWAARAVYRTAEWVRVSLPLSMVSGLLLVMSNIDILVVGAMLGPAAAGVYAVAANLARFTMFGLVAADSAAQPMIASLYSQGDTRGLRRLVVALVWTSTTAAVGIGLVLIVLRQPLLGLFGADFAEGSTVLIILALGRIANAVTGPSGSLLAMTSHQDLNALILGLTTALNVATTIAGTALLGAEGAAIGTSLALTLMTAWTWFEVRRRLGINASIFASIRE